MDVVLESSDQVPEGERAETRNEIHDEGKELDVSNCVPEGKKDFVTPAVGMEFETYEDAYNYYICYAKEMGFCVRVKNSWFKRNSRDKYGAVLCCSSQGFKRYKDVNRSRQDTRTGCPAMIRISISDSKRWRIHEVLLEHNHLLGTKTCKPTKSCGAKRKLQSDSDVGVHTIKLYQALVVDGEGNGTSDSSARELVNFPDSPDQMNLRKGDARALYSYFCRMQMTNPNFFYLMDLNEEGRLRNVFWADARSRAACNYFSDVIFVDNSFLSNKYDIPLVTITGINHHGQSLLLGCGLLASETTESYSWLFKSWTTSMLGGSPLTIVTDRCKVLQQAVTKAFPRSHHCFSISRIMKKVPEKLGGLRNYEAIRKALAHAVYETLKVIEFEASWGFMVQHFGLGGHEWLKSVYDDRTRWAPVYVREIFFAGMAGARPGETLNTFFNKHVHKQTPLKEFLDRYELFLYRKHKEESVADIESRSPIPSLKSKSSYELQLSKVYTREMFRRFQLEVEEMYSCFSTTQMHVDGPIIIFLVKERVLRDENRREVRDYEVLFNRAASEVRCICNCFNFHGYLCRHALCVLNYNAVEEVPSKYILSRWNKNYQHLNVSDQGPDNVESAERLQWYNQLCRGALQVVREGVISLEHYQAALQAFDESLNRVHDTEEKHDLMNVIHNAEENSNS